MMNSKTIVSLVSLVLLVRDVAANCKATNTCCNICGNHAGVGDLIDPEKTFEMSGKPWTCEYLQESVADVEEDIRWCKINQIVANQSECFCNGAPRPPQQVSKVLMEPCNLCKGTGTLTTSKMDLIDLNDLEMGRYNCIGLSEAMMHGIVSEEKCPKIQVLARGTCCKHLQVEDDTTNVGEKSEEVKELEEAIESVEAKKREGGIESEELKELEEAIESGEAKKREGGIESEVIDEDKEDKEDKEKTKKTKKKKTKKTKDKKGE